MIRKQNKLYDLKIERLLFFSNESLSLNSDYDKDDGELSWIYVLQGDVIVDVFVPGNPKKFKVSGLSDVRQYSEYCIKLTAGLSGGSCLLFFSPDYQCAPVDLSKNAKVLSNTTSYILPLTSNLTIEHNNLNINSKNIIKLQKNKSINFKNFKNNISHHLLLLNKYQ